MLLKTLNFLLPIFIIAGSSYYAYEAFWPKTIGDWMKDDGYEEIKTNDNHFLAMFHENIEKVNELGIEDLDLKNDSNILPKIKDWCQKNWREKLSIDLKRKLLSFCVYNPKTYKGLFIGSGKKEKLIEKDEDYKTVFSVYKYSSKLLSPISGATSEMENEKGKDILRSWCETQLKKDLKDPSIYSLINVWCTKLDYSTVKQKLNKTDKDWKMIDENNEEEWKDAFERWKHTRSVIDSINRIETNSKKIDETISKEEGGQKMNYWCKEAMDKKLYEKGIYKDEYSLFKSACRAQ